MALSPHGYILLQATDGEEALEVAVRGKPDLYHNGHTASQN